MNRAAINMGVPSLPASSRMLEVLETIFDITIEMPMHPRPCRFAKGWSAGAVVHDGSHGEGTHSPALPRPSTSSGAEITP